MDIKQTTMTKFTVNTSIHQPVEVIYQAYIAPDNMLKWSTNLEKFEIIKGRFGEVGATARLHYNEKGHKSIMEDTLEFIEPGKKLISKVSGGVLVIQVVTTFISVKSKTELKISWNGTGKNIFVKILLPLLRNTIRKRAKDELDRFKYLVEKYGVNFPEVPE
jgi:hypothetical protein